MAQQKRKDGLFNRITSDADVKMIGKIEKRNLTTIGEYCNITVLCGSGMGDSNER